MSPRKRKILVENISDESDSLNHRRSSLAVNLSYASNLIDSGNGSFKQTDVERNNNNTISTTISFDKTSKDDKYGRSKSKQTSKCTSNHGVPLKNVSVVLKKMNNDDEIFNKNCERLKQAILTKTKQVFNVQNELSIKTHTILGTTHDRLNVISHNDFTCAATNSGTPAISNTVDKIEYKNKKNDLNQSVSSTPKDTCTSKSVEEEKKHYKFKKRRLFHVNKRLNDTIISGSNNVDSKFNLSKLCLSRSKNGNHKNSAVLAGSNEKADIFNLPSNTSCELIPFAEKEKHKINCADQSVSISSTLEDESVFTAVPIGCSTMINDQILDTEAEIDAQIVYDLSSSLDRYTKRSAVSMEITHARGEFVLNDKQQFFERVVENTMTDNLSHQKPFFSAKNDSASASLVQQSIQATVRVPEEPLYKHSKKLEKAGPFNNIVEQSTQTIADNSVNTVQTSLNVNTSIDAPNKDDRWKNNIKQIDRKEKKYSKGFENRQEKSMYSVLSEEAQENINTICTSLRVNTSLDTSTRLHLQKSNNRCRMSILNDTASKNTDNEENVDDAVNVNRIKDASLNEKIKNAFVPRNVNGNDLTDQSTKNNEIRIERDPVNIKTVDKILDGQSYIEATPYPMCRSVLLKSQLKQNAVTCLLASNSNYHNGKSKLTTPIETNSKNKSCLPEQNISTIITKRADSCYEQEKTVSKTVILNNSSFREMPCIKSQTSVIIKESTDESELEKDQETKRSTTFSTKKNHKKQLLPLRECSQLLSFSPVEEEYLPPERPTIRKGRKRGKKQCIKDKFNATGDANNMECIERKSNERSPPENDRQIFFDKKKQERKPKRVISKKIVVKKIVNKDILRRLEENGENIIKTQTCIPSRSSSNDFQASRGLSTTLLPRRKAERVNIVATGLSNDDKNIVKSVVRVLGRAKIESNVTKRTTHVVTTGVRTINLLHGIIRGCWLVSLEWVLKSLENNAWLNPEEYEMIHFSKAVLENRKDRQLFGKSYVPELFAACGYVYVHKDTTPPYNVLKDLVKAAGGRITENPKIAKIIIGIEGLKETWVLDCITTGELQPYDQYQRR